MHVVVIGAGVIGSAAAARLAQGEVSVTVVDRGRPGSGTSGSNYAWLNANGKAPKPYFDLNVAGLEAHYRYSPQGDEGWLLPGGHLEFAEVPADQEELSERTDRNQAWGYPIELLSRQKARHLFPDVRIPGEATRLVYAPREAGALPIRFVEYWLGAARAAGAVVRTGHGSSVVDLTESGNGAKVRLADGSIIAADMVVCATGRWTNEVAALAGVSVPMCEFSSVGDSTVGYIAVTERVPVRLTGQVSSSWLGVRPIDGGRLMLQASDLDKTADPDNVPALDSDVAREFLDRLQRLIPGAVNASIERLEVGRRALLIDGLPAVGGVADPAWLYVVVTHSGVTLAPILADLVASEIQGRHQPSLDEFRLDRFVPHMKAAGGRL